ncbi:MAG: hypothetical protein H6Q41_6051 [Deltaproteobacteria bacterium]|nr:hypothetical protein [Deltaproteobacteria bacterium]
MLFAGYSLFDFLLVETDDHIIIDQGGWDSPLP